MKLLLISFCLIGSFAVWAQKSVFLTIKPKVSGSDLLIGNTYTNLEGTEFNLDHFDYYLSGLHIYHDGWQDLALVDTVFLVEPDNHVLFLGYLNLNVIDSIAFGIGVPANINTSSGANSVDISAYPENHPLSFQDPSMYWGWTAGYMHMIIGGLADANNDGIPETYFELHNIGDQNYQLVSKPIVQTNSQTDLIDVYLDCNIEQWLKNIPIKTVGGLHGSNGYNSAIMNNVENENVFTQPLTASIEEVKTEIGSCSFTNDAGNIIVNWKNLVRVDHFVLTSMNGQIINSGVLENISGSMTLDVLPTGLYTMSFYNAENLVLNSVKISN